MDRSAQFWVAIFIDKVFHGTFGFAFHAEAYAFANGVQQGAEYFGSGATTYLLPDYYETMCEQMPPVEVLKYREEREKKEGW